jgi:hypothetical protein
MFDWLFVLLTPSEVQPPRDYVGHVAAEVAYLSLTQTDVEKPKVPTKDCKTCNGTGRVRTGDDQGWTKCPDCEPAPGTER